MSTKDDAHQKARTALNQILAKGLAPTPENYAQCYGPDYRSELLERACNALSGLFLEHPDVQTALEQLQALNLQGNGEGLQQHLQHIEAKKAYWLGVLTQLRHDFRKGVSLLEEQQQGCSQIVQSQQALTQQVNLDSLEELQAYHQNTKTAWAQLQQMTQALNNQTLALDNLLEALEQGTPGGDAVADLDPLTQVLNRRGFMNRLKRTLASGTLVALDLDYFKRLNDRYGHPAGDFVLRTVSEILASECRAEDALGRFGGEEFLMFFPGVSLDDGADLAERLRQKLAIHRFQVSDVEYLHLTASLGVVYWDRAITTFQDVYDRADRALYEAKHEGRNFVAVKEA